MDEEDRIVVRTKYKVVLWKGCSRVLCLSQSFFILIFVHGSSQERVLSFSDCMLSDIMSVIIIKEFVC
jgi:hypothetical protein